MFSFNNSFLFLLYFNYICQIFIWILMGKGFSFHIVSTDLLNNCCATTVLGRTLISGMRVPVQMDCTSCLLSKQLSCIAVPCLLWMLICHVLSLWLLLFCLLPEIRWFNNICRRDTTLLHLHQTSSFLSNLTDLVS